LMKGKINWTKKKGDKTCNRYKVSSRSYKRSELTLCVK
jgi:hypothetical protein